MNGNRHSGAKSWHRLIGVLVAASAALGGCSEAPTSAQWLGLNTQLGHPDYDGRWPSAKTTEQDRQIYFELVSELGVPLVRDVFMSWARVQPARDAKYDFSVTDDLVRKAQAGRADILAVCWGIPRWASAAAGTRSIDFGVPSREQTEPFRAFVRKFVGRYDANGIDDMPGLRGPIRAYEFMNEMEDVSSAEYAYWLKLFFETVKATDSSAMVVLGSLRSPGMKTVAQPEGDYPTYFERLLSEPGLEGAKYPYFNAVAFHNYPASYPGRTEFDDAIAYLKMTMAAHHLSLPLWLTEYGYNSGTKEEEQQKDNIVKWALHARAAGIDRVYLYCLWDYHWPGDSGAGQNLGLVREVESGKPPPRKPAFRAFATLLQEIGLRPRVERRGDGLYLLTGTGTPTYVVWKEESYDPSSILIPNWWDVRTTAGGKGGVRQGSDIKLSSSPLFVQRQQSPFIN